MPGQLVKSPLVEALLEIRWKLQQVGPDSFQDPVYKLLIGRLYDRIHKRFGHMQELPLAQIPIPDEMTPHQVKQQFRSVKNGWPLVQLGPGVATLNFTDPYSWKLFEKEARFVLTRLLDAYTVADVGGQVPEFQLNQVLLRYINAFDLDWMESDALVFLEQKLHTTFGLPAKVRESPAINGVPREISLQIGYPLSDPKGQGIIRVATGHRGQQRQVICDLMVYAKNGDVPQLTKAEASAFWPWLLGAHRVIEEWFFAFIEGELQERFMEGEVS